MKFWIKRYKFQEGEFNTTLEYVEKEDPTVIEVNEKFITLYNSTTGNQFTYQPLLQFDNWEVIDEKTKR